MKSQKHNSPEFLSSDARARVEDAYLERYYYNTVDF